MLVFPNVSLGSVSNSAPILPYGTSSIVVGQINPQPITAMGLLCTVSAGASLTYSVQVSCDSPNSTIVNWLDLDAISGATASAYAGIILPISAIRLAVTVWASGTVNMGVVQWP